MSFKNTLFLFLFLLISYVFIQYFDYHPKIKIGIVSDAKYCGEREVAWRIKIAAENLGWKVFLDEKEGRKLKKQKKLNWIICLLPEQSANLQTLSYLSNNFPPFQLSECRKKT